MSANTKAILFIGATGGCGRSALQHSLDAGYTCIALARTPSKLTSVFPSDKYLNIRVVEGNAHVAASVTPLLVHPDDSSRLVDNIVFSIGGTFNVSQFAFSDPTVCQRGIATLFSALDVARQGLSSSEGAYPHITVISTTGISRFGRDVPAGIQPFYKLLLKVPHDDKRVMEDAIYGSNESERWTIVRPSLLVDGATDKKVRVGIEDPVRGWEKKELGCTISREDVGKWVFEEILKGNLEGKVRKTFTVTW